MKKLDKFILKSFVWPFIAILLIVIFILMMQFLWLYIDELVGKGLGMGVILEFMMWGACTLLPLSLPLATLLSSMMTLGNFAESNELLAMKSAGISLSRILLPIGIVCGVISISAFFIADDLIPVAYNQIYTLREDIGKTKSEIKIPTGTFYDGIEGYILRVDERNDETGMMYKVMVYNHTNHKGNTSLTVADSAKMTMSKDKSYLTFSMYSGSNFEETNTKKYRDTTLQLQKIEFDRQQIIIPLENYAFHKSDSARYSDQVKSMSLKELNHGKDSIGRINEAAHDENAKAVKGYRSGLKYHSQMDSTARTRITTPFRPENEGKWKDIDSEIKAVQGAISKAEDLQSTLSMYGNDVGFHTRVLRNIDIEILSKFALSLACFIFFLIGAPLGALIRKGGLGTPAIISVLFFVAYWVIDISGKKLARDGAIDPVLGVFISSYILFPTGVFLTWKAVNDSTLFNIDNIKARFRKIKAKIMGIFKKTRIVYMGTPEFSVAPLDALIKNGYDVVGVVTVADKPSGRGLKMNESAVKQYAVAHNIPVLQPVSLKDESFLEALKAWKPDLFVVVAFRLLPQCVWSIPKLGTFNLHAALLPQYRGAAPINWAVINGENMTGVTTFMIDAGVDTGKIMYREQCPILPTDTAGTLHDKLMEMGANLVVQTVEAIIEGSVEFRIQRSFIQGAEVLKPAPKITKEMCRIDWNRTTAEVYNFVRGLSPYPTAYTLLRKEGEGEPLALKVFFGEKLTGDALKAALAAGAGAGEAGTTGGTAVASNGTAVATDGTAVATTAPGRLLSDGKTFLAVTTADGALSITDLQMAGKKRMDAKAFLLGFRDVEKWSVVAEG